MPCLIQLCIPSLQLLLCCCVFMLCLFMLCFLCLQLLLCCCRALLSACIQRFVVRQGGRLLLAVCFEQPWLPVICCLFGYARFSSSSRLGVSRRHLQQAQPWKGMGARTAVRGMLSTQLDAPYGQVHGINTEPATTPPQPAGALFKWLRCRFFIQTLTWVAQMHPGGPSIRLVQLRTASHLHSFGIQGILTPSTRVLPPPRTAHPSQLEPWALHQAC